MNPITNWYNEDNEFKAIIDTISESGKSLEEQAEMAFLQLSNKYNLPKYPDSFTEEDIERLKNRGILNPMSLIEEIGILRYLDPDDDPRGIVAFAAYCVKNDIRNDIALCAKKHFGSKRKIPKSYMVYFTGENSQSKLNFLGKGESWGETGAKYAMKVLK